MKKPDGTKCTSPEENAKVFQNHFEKLYNRQSTFDPEILESLPQSPILMTCEQHPTKKDIRKALCRLKNKAPGDSGITPLMLKACTHNKEYFLIHDRLHRHLTVFQETYYDQCLKNLALPRS